MKIICGWLHTFYDHGYAASFEDTLSGITKTAEWGFKDFEMEGIYEDNLRIMYERRNELKEHIEKAGLNLRCFIPMLPDLGNPDQDRRAKALELFDLGAELGSWLGADVLMMTSYEAPVEYIGESPGDDPVHYGKQYHIRVSDSFDWERSWENLVTVTKRCARIADKWELRLTMETRAGDSVSNTDGFLRLSEAVDDPNFGMAFDTAHLHAQKEILPLSVEKLRDRIFYIHASDNDSRTNEHLEIGKGTIDWVSLFQALRKHGFDGYVTLDIGDCPDPKGAYQRSRDYLETLTY